MYGSSRVGLPLECRQGQTSNPLWVIQSVSLPDRIYMNVSANELIAKVLRLKTERECLVFVLGDTELSDEDNAQVRARLLAVEDE